MKCQIMFSRKNKKTISNWSSLQFPLLTVSVSVQNIYGTFSHFLLNANDFTDCLLFNSWKIYKKYIPCILHVNIN